MFKSAYGLCPNCNSQHFLYEGKAKNFCKELIQKMVSNKSNLDLTYLFGKARGQMFGAIELEDNTYLKAFSGQYSGEWIYKGWEKPLFNIEDFNKIVFLYDFKIKNLTKKIEIESSSILLKELKIERKILSQEAMDKIHNLYILKNFKGEKATLKELFYKKGVPSGAGDCCAPKLINSAIELNKRPISLAEFYYGKENRSKTKKHKTFYPSCEEKCRPILGFMLCGI